MLTDVFKAGQDDFERYRIPALLKSRRGTLLAFCEARLFHSDHAENKIVLKRSLDNGASWGEMTMVANAGRNSLNNPLVVQDVDSEAIILIYQEYPYTRPDTVSCPERWISHTGQDFPPNIHEAAAGEGYSGNVCRSYVRRSLDDGKSWGQAEEITRQVKPEFGATSNAGGPGIGIQLKTGRYRNRIIMPFSHGPWDAMKVYAVFSDDGGHQWHMGNSAPAPDGALANEVQMAELDNGNILLNARSFKGNKRRKIAQSADGGHTWTSLEDAPDLVEPECQGSMLAVNNADGTIRLFFCGPNNETSRRRGTLRQSVDGGASWSHVVEVHKDFFAYSSLCELSQGRLGVLFESDDYRRITFKSVRAIEDLSSVCVYGTHKSAGGMIGE